MTVLSFITMYILMYAMVDRLGNVYNSINQVYMAALMASPMVVIELALMGGMYPDKRANSAIGAAAAVAGVLFFVLIRGQVLVGDTQFLRSMIPHHAGAILMCEKARVDSPDIRKLCTEIIAGQQREIDQMKSLLGH